MCSSLLLITPNSNDPLAQHLRDIFIKNKINGNVVTSSWDQKDNHKKIKSSKLVIPILETPLSPKIKFLKNLKSNEFFQPEIIFKFLMNYENLRSLAKKFRIEWLKFFELDFVENIENIKLPVKVVNSEKLDFFPSIIYTFEELKLLKLKFKNIILEEYYLNSKEFSIELFFSPTGEILAVICKLKLISAKGETLGYTLSKNKKVTDAILNFSKAFPTLSGPISFNCIDIPQGPILIKNIIPAFTESSYLSIKSGADYATWIIKNLTNKENLPTQCIYPQNGSMLYYYKSRYK